MAGIMATKMMDRIVRQEISYYTLALCILKNITIEEAFQFMAPDPNIKNKDIRRKQDGEMSKLQKQGLSLHEIADIYGTSHYAVCKRIKRYKGARKRVSGGAQRNVAVGVDKV